ncbi:hypothetical protein NHH03_23545 [Stieleria sp. TO1_6]|uniref:hypothetical protein n=1 Tax=Stieleria tagensis TaxID=2956795 RepID=UPI00209AE5B0|nr:hypothetical protein [Stieleria tagensis]MCO8124732.1 hypothetical protein [Stieleria tagensis]
MESPINKLVSSFVWVAVLGLLLMVSIAIDSAWTILTTLALALGIAIAVINAVVQTVFFVMAMLTKGVVSLPKAAVKTLAFTGQATGITHDNGSLIWRHYLFKTIFAKAVAVGIVAVGAVVAGIVQSPVLLLFSVGIAIAFTKLPDLAELLRDNRFFERILITGNVPRETYPSNRKMLAYADDFELQRHPTGGCLSKKSFLGETLVENTVVPRLVFLDNPACSLTIASVGTAKLVAGIGPNMILSEASIVGISPKPELADLFCHRRCVTVHQNRCRRGV